MTATNESASDTDEYEVPDERGSEDSGDIDEHFVEETVSECDDSVEVYKLNTSREAEGLRSSREDRKTTAGIGSDSKQLTASQSVQQLHRRPLQRPSSVGGERPPRSLKRRDGSSESCYRHWASKIESISKRSEHSACSLQRMSSVKSRQAEYKR